MRRIIVILVLNVLFFVLSGCDKIKTELERRHLGAGTQKETASLPLQSTPQTPHPVKTFNVNRNVEDAASTRRQVVIRIDLPIGEKIQIRLIKSSVPVEESKPGEVVAPPNDVSNEAAPPKDEVPRDNSEDPVEPGQEKPMEQNEPKDEEPISEIKTDAEQEPESELKTDDSDRSQTPAPAAAPTIIIPENTTTSPPIAPEADEISALYRLVKPNPASAEAAVGSALSEPPPTTIPPSSREPLSVAPAANKPGYSSPWVIPNAEYPLRYY